MEKEKKQKQQTKTCSDCIHESACRGWTCGRYISDDSADAVEVVRCKDCAVPHNMYTGCPMLNGLVTPPDFYCPFGERKDGDGNG